MSSAYIGIQHIFVLYISTCGVCVCGGMFGVSITQSLRSLDVLFAVANGLQAYITKVHNVDLKDSARKRPQRTISFIFFLS